MNRPDKPLSEWTLGEMKEYCHETDCLDCPFNMRTEYFCRIKNTVPFDWDFHDVPAESDTQTKSEKTKPRLVEILGVEVGEKFVIDENRDGKYSTEFYIDDNGNIRFEEGVLRCRTICAAINHPERIIIRKPRLTDRELAVCRAVGARYVTRNDKNCNDNFVILWSGKPKVREGTYSNGGLVCLFASDQDRSGLFTQSVKPGECVEVEGAEKYDGQA